MPMSAYAAGTETTFGSKSWSAPPNSDPTAQPMNSVGVKTPPTAPDPTVAEVAKTFATRTAASHKPSNSPCKIAPMTL